MDGVTGIELNIAYDSASLATPDIVQGGLISGAMMVANTTKPGNIKVAIISTRAFAGSGQIINVNFASRSGSGGITVVSAKMIDINGAAVASSDAAIENSAASSPSGGTITSPGLPFSQTALDTVTDNLPNVALNGALLKSLRWNEADTSLSIEALPEAGVVEFTKSWGSRRFRTNQISRYHLEC